jgi:hypothetical protein
MNEDSSPLTADPADASGYLWTIKANFRKKFLYQIAAV